MEAVESRGQGEQGRQGVQGRQGGQGVQRRFIYSSLSFFSLSLKSHLKAGVLVTTEDLLRNYIVIGLPLWNELG